VKRQASTIVRTYVTYEPFKTFTYIALVFFVPALLLLGRAAYVFIGRRLNWFPESASNDQALVVGAVLVVLALVTFLIGVLADQVGSSRRIQEEILYLTRKQSLDMHNELNILHKRLDVLDEVWGERREDEATLPVSDRD
jgi:hypothetical protein